MIQQMFDIFAQIASLKGCNEVLLRPNRMDTEKVQNKEISNLIQGWKCL